MYLKVIDEILVVFRYFIKQLSYKDANAISGLIILLCVLLIHIIKGADALFILDLCVIISLYKSFRNLYIAEHYPR